MLNRESVVVDANEKFSSSQLEDEADLVSIFQVVKPLADGLCACWPRCVIE